MSAVPSVYRNVGVETCTDNWSCLCLNSIYISIEATIGLCNSTKKIVKQEGGIQGSATGDELSIILLPLFGAVVLNLSRITQMWMAELGFQPGTRVCDPNQGSSYSGRKLFCFHFVLFCF